MGNKQITNPRLKVNGKKAWKQVDKLQRGPLEAFKFLCFNSRLNIIRLEKGIGQNQTLSHCSRPTSMKQAAWPSTEDPPSKCSNFGRMKCLSTLLCLVGAPVIEKTWIAGCAYQWVVYKWHVKLGILGYWWIFHTLHTWVVAVAAWFFLWLKIWDAARRSERLCAVRTWGERLGGRFRMALGAGPWLDFVAGWSLLVSVMFKNCRPRKRGLCRPVRGKVMWIDTLL